MKQNKQLSDVLIRYVEKGFGSMNKNDFEVWIFNELLQCNEPQSNYVISKKLKIPLAKVKRLRYEAKLKYGEEQEEDYRRSLLSALQNAKCREGVSEGKISFAISDTMLKQYISDLLEKDGRFYDSSFNSNIVTLSANDFVYIIEQIVLSEKDKTNIIKQANTNITQGAIMPKSISEGLKSLGISISKSLLEKFIGVSGDDVVKIIQEMFA